MTKRYYANIYHVLGLGALSLTNIYMHTYSPRKREIDSHAEIHCGGGDEGLIRFSNSLTLFYVFHCDEKRQVLIHLIPAFSPILPTG